MPGNTIYARTETGDREVLSRGSEISHDCWLALVMIDAHSSVTELETQEPKLHRIAESLNWLLQAGYIKAAPKLNREPLPHGARIEPTWSDPETPANRFEPIPAQRVVRRHSSRPTRQIHLRRALTKWGKWGAIATPIAIAATSACIAFIPFSPYIPALEDMASRKLDEPVRIGALRIAFDPVPVLRLENVALGHQFQVRTMLVKLDPASLFRPKLGVMIEIESLQLDPDDFATLISLRDRASQFDSTTLDYISFKDVNIGLQDGSIGPLSGGIQLGPEGRLKTAVLGHGPVTLTLEPANTHLKVRLAAKSWEVSASSPLNVETVEIDGELTEREFTAKRIEASLLGGHVNGAARLSWDGGVNIVAELALKALDASRLLSFMTNDFSATGSLDAEVKLSAQASNIWKVADEPSVEARFHLGKGALLNLDVIEAIQSSNPLGVRGGRTPFDEASGILLAAGKQYSLRQLRINSGVISATGQAEWGSSKELTGRLNVAFKPKPALGTLPVQIAGTLTDPVLKPTDYAIAGATSRPGLRPAAGLGND